MQALGACGRDHPCMLVAITRFLRQAPCLRCWSARYTIPMSSANNMLLESLSAGLYKPGT